MFKTEYAVSIEIRCFETCTQVQREMRTASALRRLLLAAPVSPRPAPNSTRLATSTLVRAAFRSSSHRTHPIHTPRPARSSRWRLRTVVWATAANGALGAAAFAELATKDNSGTEETGEMRMLEASREEIAEKVADDDRGFLRIRHEVVLMLDLYIWEPLSTGVRFLQLVVIFVPVIVAVPALWFGRRHKDRDNERSGALWWYGLLVNAMEYAGPAFIKVRADQPIRFCGLALPKASLLTFVLPAVHSLANGLPHDQTSFQPRCARSCRSCIPMRPHIPCARRGRRSRLPLTGGPSTTSLTSLTRHPWA
jgi:hypothetical protein